MKWSGLYTPLITPFKDEKLDEEGLVSLIHFQRESGVEGLVVLGTTGEFTALSLEEKRQILKIVKKESHGLKIIVGTGSPSVQETIDNTSRAAEEGADGVLVISPYYSKPTQEGIFRYYESVSQASPLPIFAYNNPSRTGVNIETATLKRIASLPQIVGCKDSSGKLSQLVEVMNQIKPRFPYFTVLAGEDSLLFPLLTMGAEGAIASSANLVPKQIHALVQACLQKNIPQARQMYYDLFPLFEALSIETNPIPLKYAMHLCGLPAGNPRLPLTPLSSSHHSRIQECTSLYHLEKPVAI